MKGLIPLLILPVISLFLLVGSIIGALSGPGTIKESSIESQLPIKPHLCIPEGGKGTTGPNMLPCCPGLTQIGCDEPDQNGQCPPEYDKCLGVYYCTKCGDGICKPPENKCNCPQDCS